MDARAAAVWLCFMLLLVPVTFLRNEKLFPFWNSHSMKFVFQFTWHFLWDLYLACVTCTDMGCSDGIA